MIVFAFSVLGAVLGWCVGAWLDRHFVTRAQRQRQRKGEQ